MGICKINSKIVNVSIEKEATPQQEEEIIQEDVTLPDDAPARMKTLKFEGKKWYLTTVYIDENSTQPFAFFCQTNSREKTVTTEDAVDKLFALARAKGIPEVHVASTEEKVANISNTDKITRSISLLLRHGVLVKNVVGCLDGIEDVFVGSFLFHLKKFLSAYIRDGQVAEGKTCTECGGVLHFSEGCLMCVDCGHSKCG